RTIVDPVGNRGRVRQKDRVQLAALSDLGDTHIMADIETGAWVAFGQPPCRGVDAGVQEVDVEVKLTGGHGRDALMEVMHEILRAGTEENESERARAKRKIHLHCCTGPATLISHGRPKQNVVCVTT